jgi:hypothetical protein
MTRLFRVQITVQTTIEFSEDGATDEDAIDNALGCGLYDLIAAGEYALMGAEILAINDDSEVSR